MNSREDPALPVMRDARDDLVAIPDRSSLKESIVYDPANERGTWTSSHGQEDRGAFGERHSSSFPNPSYVELVSPIEAIIDSSDRFPSQGYSTGHFLPRRSISEPPNLTELANTAFHRGTGQYLGEPLKSNTNQREERQPASFYHEEVRQYRNLRPRYAAHALSYSHRDARGDAKCSVPQKRSYQTSSSRQTALEHNRPPSTESEVHAFDRTVPVYEPHFRPVVWQTPSSTGPDLTTTTQSSKEGNHLNIGMTYGMALALFDHLHKVNDGVYQAKEYVLAHLANGSPRTPISEDIKKARDRYRAENGSIQDLDTSLFVLPLEEDLLNGTECSPHTSVFAHEREHSKEANRLGHNSDGNYPQHYREAKRYIIPRNGREIRGMNHDGMAKLLSLYRLPSLENMFLHDKKLLYLQFVGANLKLTKEILDS